jgi:hypothetical protein
VCALLTAAVVAVAPARFQAYVGQCRLDQPVLDRLGLSAAACGGFIMAASLLTMLAYVVMAAAMLALRPNDTVARLTALLLVPLGATFTSFHALTPIPPGWKGIATAVQVCGTVMPLTYMLLFPDGHFVPRWTRWATIGIVAYALHFVVFPGSPIHPFRLEAWPLGLMVAIGVISLGILAQVYRFRWVATPLQRQQTKWVLLGTVVMTAGLLLVYAPAALYTARLAEPGPLRLTYNLLRDAVFELCMLGMLACFGLSIWRYRLWDIDLVIRRTLVFGGLSVALVGVYAVTVVALQALLGALVSGTRNNPAATVASTLLCAGLAAPLRGRLQGAIDRRFYRRRYDAARTLAVFGEALRDEAQADLGLLAGRLLDVVDETMQPAHLSLWLRPRERPHS